jgi:hypothetical protein
MTRTLAHFVHFSLAAALLAIALAVASTARAVDATLSFQEGINGYADSLEVFIGPDAADIPNAADGNVVGSTLPKDFLDGLYFDRAGDIQEIQLLMRYDNLFGAGAGQIPLGSKITSAKLTLTTGDGGNAQSNGPYGIAQLLKPFDASTTWNSEMALGGGAGATFAGGQNARPLDNGFRGPMAASSPSLTSQSVADMTRMVQNWSNGETNHGFVIRSGTTDGWEVFTSGVATNTSFRPKLEVMYDPTPQPASSKVALQQNVNNYAGTTMAWLRSGLPKVADPLNPFPDQITNNGADVDEAFLDGPDLGGTSPDDMALIKFNSIFASDGGSVPNNATILDAQLIVDTAAVPLSLNVGTNGDFGVQQMKVDWTTASLYTDFGGNGPDETQNEAGPVLDKTGALVADARAYLDVTSAVKNWQSGEPNYGLVIQSVDTADGWGIKFLNSSSPPQLLITYANAATLPGNADFNDDNIVDGQDLLIWQRGTGVTTNATLGDGDANGDGTVNHLDLAVLKQHFGASQAAGAASAVPEPATAAMLSIAVFAASGARRKRRG